METITNSITVETTVNLPVENAWKLWNEPQHITKWCQASADWHAPHAENDLRSGGEFKTTMAAKDGSFSFDFEGVYTNVEEHRTIEYTLKDGRRVQILFTPEGESTRIVETFEPENTHPADMQREGWQAIMNSYKQYAETAQ